MEPLGFRESPFCRPPAAAPAAPATIWPLWKECRCFLRASRPHPAAVGSGNQRQPWASRAAKSYTPPPSSSRLAQTPAGLIITARTTSTAGRAPGAPPAPSPAPLGRRARTPAPLCPHPVPAVPPAPAQLPGAAVPPHRTAPDHPGARQPLHLSPLSLLCHRTAGCPSTPHRQGPPPRRCSRRPRLGLSPCPAATPRPPLPTPAPGSQPRALPPPPDRRPTWEQRNPGSFAAG